MREARLHGAIAMKFLITAVLVVLAAAAQPADAQWRHHGGGGRHYDVQQRPGGGGGYQRPQRDFRPDYRQPDYRQPDRSMDRRDGRMTDEERRNLRRDLDRANREIYKGR